MFPESQLFNYSTDSACSSTLTMFPESQLFIYLTQPVTQLSTMFPELQLFIYLTQPVTQHLTMFPEPPQPFIYLTQPVTQHLTMFPESQPFIYLTQPVTMFPWWQLSVCLMILPLPQIPQWRLFPQQDYSSPAFAFGCDTDTHANGFPVVSWLGVCDCRREVSGEMKVDVFTSHSPHRHTSAETDSGRVQRCLKGRMYEAGRWGEWIHNQQYIYIHT